MSYTFYICSDWCEMCDHDLGNDFLSTVDHQDVCPHWRSEFLDRTPIVSHDEFSSSTTDPSQPAPYDNDDSSFEFDLIR